MKRIPLDNGWDEVKTESIRVLLKAKPFQTAGWWTDWCIRNPTMNKGGRNHCERCGLRWQDAAPEMMTYFITTDKGNKIVCETCWNQLL